MNNLKQILEAWAGKTKFITPDVHLIEKGDFVVSLAEAYKQGYEDCKKVIKDQDYANNLREFK